MNNVCTILPIRSQINKMKNFRLLVCVEELVKLLRFLHSALETTDKR